MNITALRCSGVQGRLRVKLSLFSPRSGENTEIILVGNYSLRSSLIILSTFD